jgi:hypothetical protein
MNLKEAKSSLYDEIVAFARQNPGDHSYKNFIRHSSDDPGEREYANLYWTLVMTSEIKEGPNAPPKKSQMDIIGYLEQRVNQLEKKQQRAEREERFESSGGREPVEDKTGLYDKYRSKGKIPDDIRQSFENDDEIEITSGDQSAKDIFDEMNAYVESIMQKRSTKPHLIIAGAPGVGKTTEIENKAKDYLLPGWELISESGTLGNSLTALVPFMYKYSQNKIIILDDINTIFRTNYRDPVLNFMMAILDKKAATTKPVKIDRSQINRYNKQLESINIEIDRPKLKEGILCIRADGETVYNEYISLNESRQLYEIVKPEEIKFKPNKFGFLKESNFDDLFDDFLNDDSEEIKTEEKEFDPTNVPEHFTFNSRVIMITNVKMQDINQAFRDRCLVFFIELSVDQYLERLETVLPKILNDDLDVSSEILKWAKDFTYSALSSTLKAFKYEYAIPYKSNGKKLAMPVEINRDLTFRLFEELVQKWIVFATKKLGADIKNKATRDEMSKKLLKSFVILYVIPFLKASA